MKPRVPRLPKPPKMRGAGSPMAFGSGVHAFRGPDSMKAPDQAFTTAMSKSSPSAPAVSSSEATSG